MTQSITRWGILSTALINKKVLAGARQSDAVKVVAVASRDEERARKYAREHGIERAHGSYDALLADPAVEAVYIPLPNGLHHHWTMRALEAGKHVLCEKPYSRHPSEVAEAFDLADRRGLVLSEAYMYRYNPQIERLKQLVDEGALGTLRFVNAAFTWRCDAPGDIRLDPSLDGGSLLDVGCYCVSACRLIAGEPISATAQQIIGATGVEVRLVGTLAFDNDVLAHFDSGFHLPDRSLLEVVGSEARIVVSDPWHCLEPGLELIPQTGSAERIELPVTNSYTLELEYVGAASRGEETPLLGRADALGQARTIDTLYRSAANATAL